MPTYHITAPDGSEFEVTGDGSQQDALAHIQANYQPAQPVQAPQATDPRGAVGEALMQAGSGFAAMVPAGIAGLINPVTNALGLTDRSAADAVHETQEAWTYQPRSGGGQKVSAVLNYPVEKLAQLADVTGDQANAQGSQQQRISATAANYGVEPMQARDNRSHGERALEGAGVNTLVQSIPSLLLKGKAGGVARDVSRTSDLGRDLGSVPGEPVRAPVTPPKRQGGLESLPEAAPTKEALKTASRAAYKRAEDAGAIIAPESFTKAKGAITQLMDKEGLDPTLHPKTTAALKRINETEGPVTLEKLETLRKIARDAEGAIDPPDQRLAAKVVEVIDKFSGSLAAKDMVSGAPDAAMALKEARGLWSRARKADVIDEMVDRAQTRAGAHYTQAGMEHALRQEFKTLALNPKRMRTFSPEERTAIKNIARGGAWENSLRNIGKFDPTSGGMAAFMSALLGGGGAIPTGGLSLAIPVAGFAAKRGATRITAGKVARLNEMVRRGPAPKTPSDALRERYLETR